MSSHDVVGRVRHLLHHRRVGHAGTLDPYATGVLLVCVGRATRLVQWLTGAHKRYHAHLRLGWRSTTDDQEGEISSTDSRLPTEEEMRAILPQFTGIIRQRPPAHSAIRVDGKRAYKMARSGREVIMPEREVSISHLELLHVVTGAEGILEVTLDVHCSSGTYIRSLARDIGDALGCGAYLLGLRRTSVSFYSVEDAMPFYKDKTKNDPNLVTQYLIPVNKIKLDLPVLHLDAVETARFFQGQRIAGRIEPEIEEIALYDPEGNLVGIAAIREDVLHPLVVLG